MSYTKPSGRYGLRLSVQAVDTLYRMDLARIDGRLRDGVNNIVREALFRGYEECGPELIYPDPPKTKAGAPKWPRAFSEASVYLDACTRDWVVGDVARRLAIQGASTDPKMIRIAFQFYIERGLAFMRGDAHEWRPWIAAWLQDEDNPSPTHSPAYTRAKEFSKYILAKREREARASTGRQDGSR